jgi:hypothetical protein
MSGFRIRFPCLLLLLIALSGCAATTTTLPILADDQAMIAPEIVLRLPPPAALGPAVSVAQTIVAHFHGQSFAFDAQIQIGPDEIKLVALDTLGRRALTLSWKEGRLISETAPWLPPFARPANILVDTMIAYAPHDMLAPVLADVGARLDDTESRRSITAGHRSLIVVNYADGQGWNRSATLHNLAFGYDIDIQSKVLAE